MLNIPIVVIAYNRTRSLERLLTSLARASYPGPVKLIISIDGGGSPEVAACAKAFTWQHGEKELIQQAQNLGLKNHVLRCGELSKDYDGIVLLEDDLYVSPHFYNFLQQAHKAYENSLVVAGVALYSHQYNETARLPFQPMDDGHDTYFLQLACSWGQSWRTHQWQAFERWYEKNHDKELSADRGLPGDIRAWPASWKQSFNKYLQDSNRYFVYPRSALSTNFGDSGVHHSGAMLYQVPLLYGEKTYSFPEFSDSVARYDAYCEINPEYLKIRSPGFAAYDFTVDLYGMKNKGDLTEQYVLTTQRLSQHQLSFGRELKPHELNICENIPGSDLFFGKTSDLPAYNPNQYRKTGIYRDYLKSCLYYYSLRKDDFAFANGRFMRFGKRLLKRLLGIN